MNIKIEKILTRFKDVLSELYDSRLDKLILFGSQARDNKLEGSDIDILIILKDEEVNPIKEIDRINDILCSLSLEFDEVLSCVFMSEKRFKKDASPLILNIKKEGIIL